MTNPGPAAEPGQDDEPDYYETFSAPSRRRRGLRRGRADAAYDEHETYDEPGTDVGDDEHEYEGEAYLDDGYLGHGRRRGGGGGRRGSGARRWIPALVLTLLAAAVLGGGYVGYGKLKDRLAPAADYAGPGTGSVVLQIKQGESVAAMGREMRSVGVVKSVQAFLDAAGADKRSTTIQVGYYKLKKQMSAKDALGVLVNPDNQLKSVVTVVEGARVRDVVKAIVAKTDFTKPQVVAALKMPRKLGLPATAKGNPEGYLYPATYTVLPNTTALSLLQQMVGKTVAVEKSLDLNGLAAKVNLTPQQVLTVASILEYEANRKVDYPKVARVIYNRLNQDMALQLDSTVSYTSGRQGDVWTTAAERDAKSAYNTYQNTGLPPGPIGSPGQATIDAALHPAQGNYLFFVPDFAKGTTLFTDSYAQHLRNVAQAKEYCRTHDAC